MYSMLPSINKKFYIIPILHEAFSTFFGVEKDLSQKLERTCKSNPGKFESLRCLIPYSF